MSGQSAYSDFSENSLSTHLGDYPPLGYVYTIASEKLATGSVSAPNLRELTRNPKCLVSFPQKLSAAA